MLTLLAFIVFTGISFCSYWFARVLDFCMDYGGILDFIRLNRAKKIDEPTIERAMIHIKKVPIDERVNFMYQIYSSIASEENSKWLKGITCFSCMNIRINVIITLISSILFQLTFSEFGCPNIDQYSAFFGGIFVSISMSYFWENQFNE